jgi:uncharacterized repeat protein (TIGR03803 family)
MKLNARNSFGAVGVALGLSSSLLLSARAVEPETLFNFQVGLGTVMGSLVQGPDGNFYGTTAQGGSLGSGTVFRVTPAGVLTTLVSDQPNPAPGLIVGNDGLLYGMTSAGGPSGFGTVFKMTTGGVLTNFALLNGVNGRSPLAGLVLASDGNFYGTSQQGGTNGFGAVFRVSPGGVVMHLVSFDGSSLGGFPVVGLTLGPEGNLYGITSFGGAANQGTIFKITLTGSITTLHSFQGAVDGFVRSARLTLGPDQNLYGTSRDGGSADMGAIYRISTNGVFTNLVSFAGTNGAVPWAELVLGPDGQLYGTTQLGGGVNSGTVFKVTTNGVLTTLFSFMSPANGAPEAGLLLASDGNFYGCSAGAVFQITPEGVLTTLASLYPLNGSQPQGLIVGPDGNFYGTTRDGGANNVGTIFRMTADGVLTSLFSFNSTNGAAPQAGLAVGKDGNFYGTTALGGNINSGTVFRFATNGTLTSIGSFNRTNGANPQCQLVMDADGTFYGTAPEQGPGFSGTIFRVATNGVLTTLVPFFGTNGAAPQDDGLAVGNDGNLYGTTADGGNIGFGTVFRVTPGGDLTPLFSFNSVNGQAPQGGLVLGKDGSFYGTTTFGGTNQGGFGTIFKITTNGVLTTLFNFNFTIGQGPATRLIQGNDGSLYGTTPFGGMTNGVPGSTGLGTVFRITTSRAFTSLVAFQGTNGSIPFAPLLMGNDGNLYGTTTHGGPGGGGTIFRIVLMPRLTRIAKLANGGALVTGTGLPASPFRLWTSTDPSIPVASWALLTNGIFANDGTFSFTDVASAGIPARFYRVSTP